MQIGLSRGAGCTECFYAGYNAEHKMSSCVRLRKMDFLTVPDSFEDILFNLFIKAILRVVSRY